MNIDPRKGGELRHILSAIRDLIDVTWCGHPILSCFKDTGAGGRLDTAPFSTWESWEALPSAPPPPLPSNHAQLFPDGCFIIVLDSLASATPFSLKSL